jgi:predicted dehydrogenase
MDRISESLSYKVRKVARYLMVYGVSRTLAKIRGQYHMQRKYTSPPKPAPKTRPAGSIGVGVIGCGAFTYTQIALFLRQKVGAVIVGCMDVDGDRAASLCLDYGASYYTTDADRVISDPGISLIYIASNHASHAEYAIAALKAGKAVHIEKPHVVSLDQLKRLCRAMQGSDRMVRLGFNRPNSRLGRILAKAVEAENSPMVMNWFVVGHQLPADHWYNQKGEGSRVLGNLSHWTDFMLRMIPSERRYPIRIVPTRGEQVDCNIAVTYLFGDGSVGAITFSAMGQAFEGVRERLSINCGNLMGLVVDFQTCHMERKADKLTYRNFYRNHGHVESILNSYHDAASGAPRPPGQLEYVWETGELMLQTMEALVQDREMLVTRFSPEKLEG